MRSLVKPGLFWVVRIGLFLSVAAWGIGQWWYVHFNFPALDGGCFFATSPSGLVIGHDHDLSQWWCVVTPVPDSK